MQKKTRMMPLSYPRLDILLSLAPFLFVTSSHAYDFLVTSKGGFYDVITDMATGEQIGERFQNPAINADGDRIGTSQGFAYNFPPDTSSDPANRNWIFFLDGGQVEVMDQTIVVGSGIYEKYTGGRVEQNIASVDPDYVSEITLVEPPTEEEEEEAGDEHVLHETFRITTEGGFQNPLMSADGNQIGEMFQSPVLVQNATTGIWEQLADNNIDQGFGYNYVSDTYIKSHEANNISMSMMKMLANRIFFLPGGELTVLQEAIVQGRGMYSKYTGGSLDETIISMTPTYVAEITLREKEPVDVDATATFREITLILNPESNEAVREPITNGTAGVTIGLKLQMPVSNQEGTRLGTMLAYVYQFPDPAGQTRNGNRQLYLEGGMLTIFNDAIVQASGVYAGYTGGRAPSVNNETITEITLVPPQEAEHNDDTTSGGQYISTSALLLTLVFLTFHLFP